MLNALIGGKGGRISESVVPGTSLRQIFRMTEDLLTASVFERLAYLPGDILCQILASTFRPELSFLYDGGTLDGIEFWPNWSLETDVIGSHIQPDVVLNLSRRTWPKTITFIVECKLAGQQYPKQWANEWIAYEKQYGATERADEIWLLALGGLPDTANRTVEEFKREIRREHGRTIRAAAAGWQDVLGALNDVATQDAGVKFVIADLKRALALCGYRPFRPMGEIGEILAKYGYNIDERSFHSLRWNLD